MKIIDGFKFGIGFSIGIILTSTIFYGTLFLILKVLLNYNFN